MKLYDKVKFLLEKNPGLRNSDKDLIWTLCHDSGNWQSMSRTNFMKSPSYESITRARRKVQELHPELQATQAVRRERLHKQKEKGTFIFREQLPKGQIGF